MATKTLFHKSGSKVTVDDKLAKKLLEGREFSRTQPSAESAPEPSEPEG